MKRKITVLLLLCAVFVGAFAICAAAESVYAENIQAINAGAYRLGELMDGYAEKDCGDGKEIAISTNAAVVRYVNMINDLRADGRVGSADLSGEISLLVLKGEVSGECAWIFAAYSGELSPEARERVRTVYERTDFAIYESSEYDALHVASTAHISGVILAIYEEKVAALCRDDDSDRTLGIAESALLQMRGLASVEIEDYGRIYDTCAHEMATQRLREDAALSFAKAYDLIYGLGSFEQNRKSDANIESFLRLIEDADTVIGFNSAFERTVLSVLDAKVGALRGAYVNEVVTDVSGRLRALCAGADASGEIADAALMLDGISYRILVAEKKDALAAYAETLFSGTHGERVSLLLSEYNADGGVFDSADDGQTLELLLLQAKLRMDWICECEAYKALANRFLVECGAEIASRFDELYLFVDAEICAAQSGDVGADSLRRGCERAQALSFEFEAKAYTSRHEAVINKSVSEITRADIAALQAAIFEYDTLSSSARGLLSEEISALGEKYEAALRDAAEAEAREEAERAAAERLAAFDKRRAELSEEISAVYGELYKLSSQYTEKGRAELLRIKQDALDALLEADVSIGISALSEIAESAIAAMRAVRIEWVSSGRLSSDSDGFTEYPAGYDYSVGGVWGVVTSECGMPSDIRLSIALSAAQKQDKRDLLAALRGARIK